MRNEKLVEMGRRIHSVRKHLEMIQREMSEKLGIAVGYVCEIENGNANPGPMIFLGMVEKLNISLNYIFLGQGTMFYAQDKTRGDEDTFSVETFNFRSSLDSQEKLMWLMKHSTLFKYTMLGYAEQYLLSHEEIIKESVSRYLEEKKAGSE